MKTDEDVGIVFECEECAGEEFEVGVVGAGEDDFEIPVVPQSFGDVLRKDKVVFLLGTDANVGSAVRSAVARVEDDDDFFGCGVYMRREGGEGREEKKCYYNKGSDSAQNGAVSYHYSSPEMV